MANNLVVDIEDKRIKARQQLRNGSVNSIEDAEQMKTNMGLILSGMGSNEGHSLTSSMNSLTSNINEYYEAEKAQKAAEAAAAAKKNSKGKFGKIGTQLIGVQSQIAKVGLQLGAAVLTGGVSLATNSRLLNKMETGIDKIGGKVAGVDYRENENFQKGQGYANTGLQIAAAASGLFTGGLTTAAAMGLSAGIGATTAMATTQASNQKNSKKLLNKQATIAGAKAGATGMVSGYAGELAKGASTLAQVGYGAAAGGINAGINSIGQNNNLKENALNVGIGAAAGGVSGFINANSNTSSTQSFSDRAMEFGKQATLNAGVKAGTNVALNKYTDENVKWNSGLKQNVAQSGVAFAQQTVNGSTNGKYDYSDPTAALTSSALGAVGTYISGGRDLSLLLGAEEGGIAYLKSRQGQLGYAGEEEKTTTQTSTEKNTTTNTTYEYEGGDVEVPQQPEQPNEEPEARKQEKKKAAPKKTFKPLEEGNGSYTEIDLNKNKSLKFGDALLKGDQSNNSSAIVYDERGQGRSQGNYKNVFVEHQKYEEIDPTTLKAKPNNNNKVISDRTSEGKIIDNRSTGDKVKDVSIELAKIGGRALAATSQVGQINELNSIVNTSFESNEEIFHNGSESELANFTRTFALPLTGSVMEVGKNLKGIKDEIKPNKLNQPNKPVTVETDVIKPKRTFSVKASDVDNINKGADASKKGAGLLTILKEKTISMIGGSNASISKTGFDMIPKLFQAVVAGVSTNAMNIAKTEPNQPNQPNKPIQPNQPRQPNVTEETQTNTTYKTNTTKTTNGENKAPVENTIKRTDIQGSYLHQNEETPDEIPEDYRPGFSGTYLLDGLNRNSSNTSNNNSISYDYSNAGGYENSAIQQQSKKKTNQVQTGRYNWSKSYNSKKAYNLLMAGAN